jgi:hypothetical protein
VARRLAVALVVLAAAVGALVVFSRRQDRETREERRAASLLRFDDREVRAIDVHGAGTEARFERAGRGWRMTAPVADAVEPEEVESLLRATKRSPVLRVVDRPEALASYGLDPPVASVRIEAEREVPRLDLGIEDPTRQGIFARVEGRPGVLLLGYPDSIVLRGLDPNRFRDPSLAGLRMTEVVAATVQRGGGGLRLERGRGGWWIAEPSRMPASDTRVDSLLSGLERIVPAVLDDSLFPPPPDLGLDPPEVRIVLDTAGGKRELRFGRPRSEGWVPAVRDDRETVMRIDRSAIDGLPLDEAALADTKLTKANRYEVTFWEDVRGSLRVVAERSGESTWADALGRGIPEDRVLGYLARVLEAPVAGIERGPSPTSDPRVVRFRLADGSEDRIRVHPERVATVDSLPGIVFRLKADLPPPPSGQ